MNHKLTKLFAVLTMLLTVVTPACAQKTMDVSGFTRLDDDLMARVTKPVRDTDQGKLCALIRIVTDLSDLEVRADALGIVKKEEHKGELWLYVPYGAKKLSFMHEGYFPLMYQYPMAIEEGTVYELRLSSLETTDALSQSANTQLFVLTHQPEDAKVFVDDMEVQSEFGVFAAMMSKGDHHYKVIADQYEDAEGSFTLENQPVRETAKLAPLFGTFQLFTLPENGFNVSINDRQVGVSPFKSGRLEPGSYRIHIEKEKFYAKDTLIRVREGDELQFTSTLTSHADSLFYNRELGGRKLSFGVTAGYVMPFPMSSSGGGFTGSAVNYSMGDSREDVDYTSQGGFTVGLFADLKLYKNFYLTAGVNYTMVKYKNTFSEPFDSRVWRTVSNIVYYMNSSTNNYQEKYTQSMIEVPVLVSYRFVLTKTGSLHLNLGPYVSFGLNSKMELSGSSEFKGNIYLKNYNNTVDYDNSKGIFSSSDHISGDFNMYKRRHSFEKTTETDTSLGNTMYYEAIFDKSPFKRFNYGLKFGLTYELRGFQIGAMYSLQLSNMANDAFWESTRIPITNRTGENVMSGYKHCVNALEIKLGYVFRY